MGMEKVTLYTKSSLHIQCPDIYISWVKYARKQIYDAVKQQIKHNMLKIRVALMLIILVQH